MVEITRDKTFIIVFSVFFCFRKDLMKSDAHSKMSISEAPVACVVVSP